MTIRRLKSWFGIDARRVAVRAAVPWYWRVMIGVALAALIIVIARYTYDFGRRFAGFDRSEADAEFTQIVEQLQRMRTDLEQTRSQAAAGERQSQIDKATVEDLRKDMRQLAAENAGLKEDLAVFQTLMPAGTKEGVSVDRFEVRPDGAGEYRYRMLIMQTGSRSSNFQGRIQFTIDALEDRRRVALTVPGGAEADPKPFELNFRFYQRVEGSFHLPPGVTAKSVQLRIFEAGSGEPRFTRRVDIS